MQGARNSTTLLAAHSLSAAGSEHLNVPTASASGTSNKEPGACAVELCTESSL